MRLFAFFLLASLAVAQQPQQTTQPPEPPKKARIEGSVVSLTGEPIPRAQVRLAGAASIQNGQISQPTAFTATADDAGKFTIENIEPGRNYQLTAQRPGFVNARYGARSATAPGAPLSLEAGQPLKGLSIVMTPQGIISGRITDEAGDPVQGSLVAVMRRAYQRGVRTLVPVSTSQTNDQGEYRVPNLGPGRYYLSVSGSRILALSPVSSSERTANVTTYYPNSPDVKSAAPLDITPGTELRGIDVRLRKARVFSVRGKAVDANGAPVIGVLARAVPREEMNNPSVLVALTLGTSQTRAPDGAFEIPNLVPGSYVVQAQGNIIINGTPAPRMSGRLEVTITDADITGVTWAMTPGATIKGTMRVENGDITKLLPAASSAAASPANTVAALAGLPGAGPTVMLVDAGGGGTTTAQVKGDATFTLEGVASSKFQLNLNALPQGHFVKSATFSGTDVTKTELDLTSGAGGTLDIVLSNKAADVAGVVRPQKEESIIGVTVTLWPRDPEPGSINNGIKTVYSDQNGGFQFQSLRPGVYYAAAWEDIDSGLALARDFLTQFTSDATKLELSEGGHSATEVKLIPAAKIKAAEEKLP